MTDEQKQKRREANRRYQKKYRGNMSDKQKQKQRDYQIYYRKKYYAAKKLNKLLMIMIIKLLTIMILIMIFVASQ